MMFQFSATEPLPDDLIRELIGKMKDFRIWCFDGNLGAGKTSLIRSIGNLLGFGDQVSSPTFSLIQQYDCSTNPWGLEKVYHMDLYRLRSVEEAQDAGVLDCLHSGELCLIEWPELILPLIEGEKYAQLSITTNANNGRDYRLNTFE